MLLSMTGFGEAHHQDDGLTVAIEVRTINNRYFKLSMRCGEGYTALEPHVESLVRQRIKRGTVQVNIRTGRKASPDDYSINTVVLDAYRRQLEDYRGKAGTSGDVSLGQLLQLPGVIDEKSSDLDAAEADWPAIKRTLETALEHLDTMRREEGRAMGEDLAANCRQIAAELKKITARAPAVVETYRARLEERVRKALEEHEITLNAADLVREVAIFADRSDISEEIVRLESHLDQFDRIMTNEDGAGRKLEFLIQEMFREVNTIGSKSNDVEIARHVIEIKTAIERLREMIQNVE